MTMSSLPFQKISKRRREELAVTIFLLAPATLIMAAVMVYPMVSSFWISLHLWDLTKPQLGHPFAGLMNYLAILKDPAFWQSAQITFFFVAGAVALEITLGLGLALLLNRDFRGKNLVRVLALLPWAIPGVVNGIMWKWIFNPSYGALNGLLYSLGLINEYQIWLGNPKVALIMCILADTWKETPFIMLIFLAALQTIPKDLYEAAWVDGCNAVQALFRITIPLIKPTLFVALSLRTIWALKSFDLIYTLTAGGPAGGTTVIGYYTYIKAFVSLNLGRGAAAAFLMTLIVIIIVYFYQRALFQEVQE
ncbi:MAG: carbohydrate ABC transporter permease [Chloroflexota bacterium]